MEKKVFEEPKVTKVEIDFNDRVIAAGCDDESAAYDCSPNSGRILFPFGS